MEVFAEMPDRMPEAFYEPMVLPLILSVVAFTLFAIFRHREIKQKAGPLAKWISLLPAVVGAFIGYGSFSLIRDKFYYESIKFRGDKMIWAHYAGFIIPLVFILAAVGWYLLDKYAPEEYVEIIEQA